MRFHHPGVARLGQHMATARHCLGKLDRGMRTARAVHDEVKKHVPSNKISQAAEKGLSSYEAVREKIRMGSLP